jgi:hypothetical protein
MGRGEVLERHQDIGVIGESSDRRVIHRKIRILEIENRGDKESMHCETPNPETPMSGLITVALGVQAPGREPLDCGKVIHQPLDWIEVTWEYPSGLEGWEFRGRVFFNNRNPETPKRSGSPICWDRWQGTECLSVCRSFRSQGSMTRRTPEWWRNHSHTISRRTRVRILERVENWRKPR